MSTIELAPLGTKMLLKILGQYVQQTEAGKS